MPETSPLTVNWSKRKLRLFKFALLLAALLCGLLIAETALRFVGFSYPVFYTIDTVRGYALEAGVSGWYRKEGTAFVRINSDGLRDREHTKAKPANTFRIALIGDSYAEALQVPLEDAFWVRMEGRLQTCAALAGKNLEIINFGVSGYSTAQELLTLREKAWDYAPDLILLAMTTNNDITDNLRAFKKTDQIPYFVYRDGRLTLDNSFRESLTFRLRNSAPGRAAEWIRDHLRVIQAFHQAHYALKNYLAARKMPALIQPVHAAQTTNSQAGNARPANAPATTNAVIVSDELGIDNLIYREPADARWEEAWRVTEALLLLMRDEVRERGAQFVVVTLSNGVQVHPQPAAREAFMRRVGATDLFYPDTRLKSLGDRAGFPIITLVPALQQYAEQHQVFLHGFGRDIGNGHWNRDGHHLAGELLAPTLCDVIGKGYP
ncbi:MAG: SGNH/GDSL hydrolase family protein [Pyrinomonadaceae bacterium]